MKRRSLVAALLVISTATAYADPHKVLVLQSEGRADGVLRAKIDASVLRLAKGMPAADVSPGDTTLSDAAAAVGCKPETATCRDEIMGMLAVDELVYTNLTSKPGGTEVQVHRSIKGGTTTDARVVIASKDSLDKLDGIAPLFGARTGDPITPPGTPPTEPAKPVVTDTPPPTEPANPVVADITPTEPVVVTQPTPSPAQPVDTGPSRGRKRLELAGMIGGGALVLIGFMCWGSAADIQSQIDESPTQTKSQLDALADLEASGDSYAGWGNALFIGGAILGGVSTYFFIKDRRAGRHATTARIAPTVFDHGAGIALSFGAP
ncbi:MAG: hypothetical protein H0T46_15760 [Deltaproteobacteria bacterium]|nr:hypothetical protein [Deltaproteobacteria bacterium]